MQGINKATLIGNLGKDPEIRNLDNGRSRVSFSLATNEVYKNRAGEKVSQTEWHNIVLWTPLAEIAEKYLRKGSLVYIEGRISYRSYEDKEGNMKYITEITGRDLTMLDSRNTQGGEYSSNRDYEDNKKEGELQVSHTNNSSDELDDLPF